VKESILQKQVIITLMRFGYLVIRMNSGAVKTDNRYIRNYIIANNGKSSGLSDVIAFKDNKVYLFEIKSSKGKQSESQKEFQELCKFYKVTNYFVINDFNDFLELEKKIRNELWD